MNDQCLLDAEAGQWNLFSFACPDSAQAETPNGQFDPENVCRRAGCGRACFIRMDEEHPAQPDASKQRGGNKIFPDIGMCPKSEEPREPLNKPGKLNYHGGQWISLVGENK